MRLLARMLAPLAVDPSGWLLLVVVACVGALFLVLALRFLSSRTAVVSARRRLVGCLLEMSMYGSDSLTTLRAFGASLLANGRYLLLLSPSVVASVLLLVPLYLALDGYLGLSEPALGEALLIEAGPFSSAIPELLVSPRYVVEAGPVLSLEEGYRSWRVARVSDGAGSLRFVSSGGDVVWDQLLAGRGHVPQWLRREQSLDAFEVSIDWAEGGVRVGGRDLPWQLPFLLLLSGVAAVLMKRMHVTI